MTIATDTEPLDVRIAQTERRLLEAVSEAVELLGWRCSFIELYLEGSTLTANARLSINRTEICQWPGCEAGSGEPGYCPEHFAAALERPARGNVAEGPRNVVIKADGSQSPYLPEDGRHYTTQELKAAIGGGYLEIYKLADGRLMVRLKDLPANPSATALYLLGRGATPDYIAGDVLVCEDWLIE